jgi:hypothetical protein
VARRVRTSCPADRRETDSAAGKPFDVYLFPDTDHGMFEFTTHADGSRKVTRIADGYLKLLGDWIKGRASGNYGRAEKLAPR